MARNTQRNDSQQKAPDFLAWHIAQKGEKSFWTRVGAAWRHRDGNGYTIQLETCPLGGRIVLRQPLEDAGQSANEGAH